MNIMTALFDQDEVTRALIAAKENRARKTQEKATRLEAIKSIMTNLGISLEKAMNVLEIPVSERAYYIQQIEGKADNK